MKKKAKSPKHKEVKVEDLIPLTLEETRDVFLKYHSQCIKFLNFELDIEEMKKLMILEKAVISSGNACAVEWVDRYNQLIELKKAELTKEETESKH
jgi:hypothetical protein